MKKEAVFPGSFDPFHKGHDFVVQEALKEGFERIYIVVSWNEDKKRNWSLEQAQKVIEDFYQNNEKIVVLVNRNQLTVEVVQQLNCFNIIRGYRNEDDLVYENELKEKYLMMEPRINFILYWSKIGISSTQLRKKGKKMI